jgi:hypothetical protein
VGFAPLGRVLLAQLLARERRGSINKQLESERFVMSSHDGQRA